MIDKTELSAKISEAADTFLADIQLMSKDELNENLRFFAEKCKSIAERILEVYIKEIKNRYTEGAFTIEDPVTLGKFVDFSSGYQHQMLEWIRINAPKVEEIKFDLPEKEATNSPINTIKPETIAISGTVIAVGLFIFTNIWIALAAEIITCLATLIQKKNIAKSKQQILIEQEYYEQELIAKKDQLVAGMISDLDKWLDNGEQASNTILKEYNI
ncbi:MAG: hypothetical protein HDS64_08720 [Bacteroidales bacterium]|nr:hypothetical protein [Bacteroidales bacterium]MBD5293374.1 hypothetical protein [Bacteroides sp.]